MSAELWAWLTSIIIMATGVPPVPAEYLERGLVRGDECGAYTNVCWWAIRREGIGPLVEHPRSGTTWLRTLGGLSHCESRHDRWSRYLNRNGTWDRGPMQINDGHWPDVADAQAHNPTFAYPWSMGHLVKGRDSYWVCWEIVFGERVLVASS